MSFIDTLRSARASRVAILHEFWIQYDPRQKRIHAFFEGHDDVVFFAPHIERMLPEGFRLCRYRCEGKRRVIEAFKEITTRAPDVRRVLFFVDKDLDDILGMPWPTDPRVYVTDVYSIENYIVSPSVLRRLYRDSVRLSGVNFDDEAIIAQFERQLARFHCKILTVMAWILVVRRGAGRPNINNIEMHKMFCVTEDCELRPVRGSRLELLTATTPDSVPRISLARLREATRELAHMPVKRIVRGKFEAWFMVEFWKKLIAQLRSLALEGGGKVNFRLTLDHSTFVPTLSPYADLPHSLDLFLRAHLSDLAASPEIAPVETIASTRSWWQRLIGGLFKS